MRRLLCDVLAVMLGILVLILFAPFALLCKLLNDDDPAASYEGKYW